VILEFGIVFVGGGHVGQSDGEFSIAQAGIVSEHSAVT